MAIALKKIEDAPWYIIRPTSLFMSYWDAFTSIALIITALVTPFEVSFLEPGGVDALFVMNRLIDVTFLADMALSMPVWGSNADCAKNLLLTHVSGPRVGNRLFPDVPGRAGGQC